MAEAGFQRPAAESAATSATPPPTVIPVSTIPSPTEQNDVIVRFEPDYLTTVPGIVKIVQISMSLLGFICIQVSLEKSSPVGRYYSWTSMIAVCFSGTLLGLYLFHVVEKYQHKIPWLKIELGFCGIWTILFLVASSLTIARGNGAFMASGNIGLRTSAAYGVDFYLKRGGVLRGKLAQEKRIEYQFPVTAVNTPVVSTVQLSSVQQC